jgi:Uma2 family endonuclease
MAMPLRHRRFTLEQYHRMGEAGILHEDDRVELIDGEIVEMGPIGDRHAACVNKVNRAFSRQVGDRAIVSVQNPVHLPGDNEPQPAVSILRARADFYAAGGHETKDILLVIEVADTSLAYDLNVKVPIYARSGIPEVWVVDVERGRVHAFRDPAGGAYGTRETIERGGMIAPRSIDAGEFAVDELIV